jgi:hypothetical protein
MRNREDLVREFVRTDIDSDYNDMGSYPVDDD